MMNVMIRREHHTSVEEIPDVCSIEILLGGEKRLLLYDDEEYDGALQIESPSHTIYLSALEGDWFQLHIGAPKQLL